MERQHRFVIYAAVFTILMGVWLTSVALNTASSIDNYNADIDRSHDNINHRHPALDELTEEPTE